MGKDSGYIVELADGRKARTFHRDKRINGKAMVYLCIQEEETKIKGFTNCKAFSEKASLVDPDNTKIIGFID